MAYILFGILLVLEPGFAAFELTRSVSKSVWTSRRFITDGLELVLFLIMTFLVKDLIRFQEESARRQS